MKIISLLIILTVLAGCAGGTIGGLLPAPKILKGKLDDLVYTSPDGVFSVKAPVQEERGEWRYTEVTENNESSEGKNIHFVGFKTPYDSHFYTVEVVNYTEPLNQAQSLIVGADNILRVTVTTQERWQSKVNVLTENMLECGSNTYSYTVLQQHINSHNPSFDKYFLMSQLFQYNSLVIVISELNYDHRMTEVPVEDIKNMNIERHNNFVCSVHVHSANADLLH